MAYTKQTWNNGDIITAEKLNNMEEGIASGEAFVINVTWNETGGTLDKTYAEILQAIQTGKNLLVRSMDAITPFGTQHTIYYIHNMRAGSQSYSVRIFQAAESMSDPTESILLGYTFTAATDTDTLVYSENG